MQVPHSFVRHAIAFTFRFVMPTLLALGLANASACDEHKGELLKKIPPNSFLHDPLKWNQVGPRVRENWMDQMRKEHIELVIVSFEFEVKSLNSLKITSAYAQYFSDVDGSRKLQLTDNAMEWLMTAAAQEEVVPSLLLEMKKYHLNLLAGSVSVALYADECIPNYHLLGEARGERPSR